MLRWAAAFFIVAIVAAIFGFGDIAAAATGVAKILFYVFLILLLISLISGMTFRHRVDRFHPRYISISPRYILIQLLFILL